MTALLFLLLAAHPELHTVAEQSNFQKTGRYDEVISLCAAYEQAYPGKVKCENFGTTPEGRPMLALIVSGDGTLTPEDSKRKLRSVVFFQGGIHAGEIDGKDAGFEFVRDALDGKVLPGLLTRCTLVFVPVFNVDGHERFSKNNRPNQRGPEEMGWRVNAQNLNLNRDYVKADSPEMGFMLKFMERWDPILFIDLHVTDGAKFQHDVAVLITPAFLGPYVLKRPVLQLRDQVMKALKQKGHLPLPFYPAFVKDDDPHSGFAFGVSPPRFSHSYWALRNRIGVLVETHSWRPYPYRVKTTYDALEALLAGAMTSGLQWQRAAEAADALDLSRGGTDLPLVLKETDKTKTIDFKGYHFTEEPSEISGQKWIRYDESKPEIWKVPFHEELVAAMTARVPKAGWVVPAGYAERVAQKLSVHGFKYTTLTAATGKLTLSVYRAETAKFGDSSYEGRQVAQLDGKWADETRELPKNSIFIPSAQPGAQLLTHMLEPNAPDSLSSWGFFNAAYEQKEYMEDYVAEEEARRMLAEDPKLKAEFDEKLKDPAFAKDSKARLQFFYRRHPAWDKERGVYPVFKLDSAGGLGSLP